MSQKKPSMGRSYLLQTTCADWNLKQLLDNYTAHIGGGDWHVIYKLVKSDVEFVVEKRPSIVAEAMKFIKTLELYEEVQDSIRDKADSQQFAELSNRRKQQPWDNLANTGSASKHPTKSTSKSDKATSTNKKRKATEGITETEDSMLITKGKKTYQFCQMKPSTSTHKPTLAVADSNPLSPLYFIKINDTHPTDASTPQFLILEYQANRRKQSSNHPFHKRPMSLAFLKAALQQELESLPYWTWAPYEHENKASDDEKMTMKLMWLTLTDFYALKPDYPTKANERTAYAEYVIPVLKYFYLSPSCLRSHGVKKDSRFVYRMRRS